MHDDFYSFSTNVLKSIIDAFYRSWVLVRYKTDYAKLNFLPQRC